MVTLLNIDTIAIGVKLRPSWWAVHYSREAGLVVLQLGPLILEASE